MKKLLFSFSLFLFVASVWAQKQAPANWFNLDFKKDKVYGVSTEKAYAELLKGRKSTPVIVAVIDGGTEVKHEDLQANVWQNSKEIAGNSLDDDGNGYVDDINGWSFIGGKNGDVVEDNLEVTRLYAKLKPKFDGADTLTMSKETRAEYDFYRKVRREYNANSEEYFMYKNIFETLENGTKSLQKSMGKDSLGMTEFKNYTVANSDESIAKQSIENAFVRGKKDYVVFSKFLNGLQEPKSQIEKFTKYNYNTSFDPRGIVGDDYENITERNYGNNHVSGPKGDHGTHVAGIIGAVRGNNLGMDGVADNVRILVVRCVPDGDERDKDVANAIRYAVDNGARVINMSFGKNFSPGKLQVDEAVRYAVSKDVLLVHGAGNDAKDIDVEDNFPNDKYQYPNGYAQSWVEVGACSWEKGKKLAAEFSNYGKQNVDVFAPGVNIYSTIPENKYASFNGTSMASPVTAGVAALIRSYFPNLTANQTKEILLNSVTKIKKKTYKPGTKQKVKFAELCQTGGVVNAYAAIELAIKQTAK